MRIYKFALACLLTLFAGCSAFSNATDPLAGISWELYTLGDTRPIDGSRLTISFEDGNISGTAGCNSYGGSYQLDGDRIFFGEIFATLMACVESEGRMDQEALFLRYLGEAQRFELADGQLQIFWSEHEALTFVPAE